MSTRRRRWAVGLMSGTSMDGIDAALVELSGRVDRPRIHLRAFRMMPYPSVLRKRLMRIAGGEATTAMEISRLNFALGGLFAESALAVCNQARIAPHRLAVIGSHGQTVFHQGRAENNRVKKSLSPANTLQIGEASIIAERTGAPVVADFRPADIAAGGHGAPLAPVVDYLLFGNSDESVATLNIGGIANVTIVPVRAKPKDVIGFDTGPGNMVVDELIRYFTGGRRTFDREGQWARRGAVLQRLLDRILRLPFFRQHPPKSAGREQFGSEFVNRYFLHEKSSRPEDLVRTATELTVQSVAAALRSTATSAIQIHRMIVSGGGVHNEFLLERLREILPEIEIAPSDRYGVPADAKEAIAFALLADRRLRGLPGNLPSVTGARRPVLLGKLVRL
ncbi:MAG TPA: anhydro-N-acetylmuramic acid kinase [Terriglobia bacterium]|nr:anhydro-N-acetylmuramic acid kinase [Terriglobia bacterium]